MADPKTVPTPYFDGLSPEELAEALRAPLDWEALLEQQAPPALVLGAERRLRR